MSLQLDNNAGQNDDSEQQRRLGRVNAHLRALADDVAASAGDLCRIRELIDDYSRVHESVLGHAAVSTPVAAAGVPCEWLTAANSDPSSRLMYVHGGSWMSGSLDGYRAHAGRIAEATGSSVLNVDYRLAPEHPFPAGLEDCNRALDWMMQQGPDGAAPATSVFVAGDSAGGNLVLALLIKRRNMGKTLPNGVIALSPATDLSWSSPSFTTRAKVEAVLRPERIGGVVPVYVQGHPIDDPLVSPLFGDLSGLPPVLIQVGEAEVLFDDSTRFADKAIAAGTTVALQTWPDMPHVFQMFAPYLRAASDALSAIGEFVASNRAHV